MSRDPLIREAQRRHERRAAESREETERQRVRNSGAAHTREANRARRGRTTPNAARPPARPATEGSG